MRPRLAGFVLRSIALAALTFCGGCLLPGCTFDASKIAGFSTPGVDWQKGQRLRLSADFSGHAVVKFHPDGSLAELDVDMRQKASTVVDAEGRRAEYLPATYEIVAQSYAQQTAAWVGLIDGLISKAISAAPSLMDKWAAIQGTKGQRDEGTRGETSGLAPGALIEEAVKP